MSLGIDPNLISRQTNEKQLPVIAVPAFDSSPNEEGARNEKQ